MNEEGPLHSRYAIVRVTAPMSWLTCGGMCDEDEGWAEVWKDIAQALRIGRLPSLHSPVKLELKIDQEKA